jgi:hypothetical protein
MPTHRRDREPRRGSLFLPFLTLLLLGGCPAASPAPVPPADPDPQVQPRPRDDTPPVVVAPPGDAGGAVAVDRGDGEPCLEHAECASGVCEGQGCGVDEPGVCAPAQRACTRDLRPYCGCDGQTFRTSGSCPGQRYEFRGECVGPRTAGEACLSAGDCASGICEGQGCGPDEPGVCAEKGRRCTADLVQYCGCDGVTFGGSSTCPGRRYSARRACDVD